MYYYGHVKDIRPKVIFLTGCLVDRVHDKEMEGKGYWVLSSYIKIYVPAASSSR